MFIILAIYCESFIHKTGITTRTSSLNYLINLHDSLQHDNILGKILRSDLSTCIEHTSIPFTLTNTFIRIFSKFENFSKINKRILKKQAPVLSNWITSNSTSIATLTDNQLLIAHRHSRVNTSNYIDR